MLKLSYRNPKPCLVSEKAKDEIDKRKNISLNIFFNNSLNPKVKHNPLTKKSKDQKDVSFFLFPGNICPVSFPWTKQKKMNLVPLTTNCWASGQDCLENRLTATKRLFSSLPLKTTLGAFSLLSETMYCVLNPLVALRSSRSGRRRHARPHGWPARPLPGNGVASAATDLGHGVAHAATPAPPPWLLSYMIWCFILTLIFLIFLEWMTCHVLIG